MRKYRVSLILLSVLMAYSCAKVEKTELVRVQPPEPVHTAHPQPVDLDYEEIRERKVIRMLTRYHSTSYFLHKGISRGFDYELISRFAKEHGLKVQVVLIRPGDDPVEMLNRGEADLIAGNYAISQDQFSHVAFSNPYHVVSRVLIYNKNRMQAKGLAKLHDVTVTVRKNHFSYQVLRSLYKQGHNFKINIINEDWNAEKRMMEVAEGGMDATVVRANEYRAMAGEIPGVESGMVVSKRDSIAWAVRKNAPELKQKLDEFLANHIHFREEGGISRSKFLSILNRRYFENNRQASRLGNRTFDTIYSGYLSPYDDMVKSIAEEAGVNWKLVIAVMAQESAFDPNAESWAGARGLMQIIPRFSVVENDSLLYDPETNIREGVRYLQQHLHRYAHLDSLNRYSLALATYNAGMGHIADARRLTAQLGNNPDEWKNISDALLKLMDREYYQHARYGFKRGMETVNYVEDVLNRFGRYTEVHELATQYHEQGIETMVSSSR